MIQLQKYEDTFETAITDYIIAFFGFHIVLNGKTGRPDDRQAKKNLAAWTGKIIRGKPGYTAVCMDVAPRNSSALHLYRELGYDTLSIVTVPKEFEENPSDDMVDFLGHRFKI